MSSNFQRSDGVHSLAASDEIWLKNKVRAQLLDLGESVVLKRTKLFLSNNGCWEKSKVFSYVVKFFSIHEFKIILQSSERKKYCEYLIL